MSTSTSQIGSQMKYNQIWDINDQSQKRIKPIKNVLVNNQRQALKHQRGSPKKLITDFSDVS